MKIKIRFNTEKEKSNSQLPAWRVLVDGRELLAENIIINVKTWTSMDEIAPGKWKWHISCEGTPTWDNERKNCTIS